MEKAAVIIAILLAFTVPVLAADDEDTTAKQSPNFPERKAEIMKRLNDQIRNLQEAKTCVQAAKNNDAIKSCREKQMAERKQLHEKMKKKIYRDEQQNK